MTEEDKPDETQPEAGEPEAAAPAEAPQQPPPEPEKAPENNTAEVIENDKPVAAEEPQEGDALLTKTPGSDEPTVKIVSSKENGPASDEVMTGGRGGPVGSPSIASSLRRLTNPIMFEGERPYSLLRPRFSNPQLESHYRLSYFDSETFRFRAALVYFIVFLIVYLLYYAISDLGSVDAVVIVALFAIFLVSILVSTFLPFYTSENFYIYHYTVAGLLLLFPLFSLGKVQPESLDSRYMTAAAYPMSSLTAIFTVLVILYTVTAIPVLIVFTFGCLYSFTFEVLYFSFYHPPKDDEEAPVSPMVLFTRLLLHMCLHVLGVHFSHYYSSRKRELFNKKGRSILASQEIVRETTEVQNLINSVMPKSVAEQLIKNEEEAQNQPMKAFRDLYVDVMDNVSILFADIVGFTNMSSGKTAEELLDLLNDLYGRFDRLAEETGCEKIATLGDCYYCVSGCPVRRDDHAKCAINMGLAMIQAIRQFDEDRAQTVQMRVGVHTGKVICGVVGVRRHKFDILSDDVFIANDMESSGEPSSVHISEYTKMALEKSGDHNLFTLKEYKPDEEKSSKLSRRTHKKTYLVTKQFSADEAAAPASPSKKAKEGGGGDAQTDGSKTPSAVPASPAISAAKNQTNEKEDATEETPLADKEKEENAEDDRDQQLISLLKDNPSTIHTFTDTPINFTTLWFKPSLEKEYKKFFQEKIKDEVRHENLKCTALIYDLLPTFTLYSIMTFCLMIAGAVENESLGPLFYIVVFLTLVLVVCIVASNIVMVTNCSEKYSAMIGSLTSGWVVCHGIGISMLVAPILVLFVFASCAPSLTPYFCYVSIILWLHFANYPRLSTLFKMLVLVILSSLVIVPVMVPGLACDVPVEREAIVNGTNVTLIDAMSIFCGEHPIRFELLIQYILLWVFVWMVSVDFETMIRANFHADIMERNHKEEMVRMNEKTQTKLLNIMPAYVVDHFNATNTRLYSASRQNVGIIFFFVDFWASYSEDYKDGAEYIRLLNELVSDFDALLDEEKYKYVEKIKTISSTYMAASNLNPAITEDWQIQLSALMDFMLQLRQKLKEFCDDIPGQSTYISKGGINFGPVTAGVIGSSKLHFDIWGDAVNVSSRMYSTGDSNMLQMTEKTKDALIGAGWDKEKFVYRKKVFVKGKGDMETYYFKYQV